MKRKILVTDATYPGIIDYLSYSFEVVHNQADQDYDESALIQKLQDKAGVFAHPTQRFAGPLFAACPRLKAVCNMAVGYNNIARRSQLT
jgi:gluconate 2-dehydrogenase